VTEAVRQLQRRAGDRQLASCELAFVNGNGGIMSEQVSLVLGVDDQQEEGRRKWEEEG